MALVSHDSIQRVMDGSDQSLRGGMMRALSCAVEPIYAGVMAVRNRMYGRGMLRADGLGRPTISVGNITTGGTGKTPVVSWLANRLRSGGHHPAILLRGYKSAGGISDEQQLLDQNLNSAAQWVVPVQANPSRVESAAAVLRERPEVDAFVLDDAFQHRRVRRDFDLVLISAVEPFGFGHVLPRGMLREPLVGLLRADAFLITRASQAVPGMIEKIRAQLARYQPAAPIYCADHLQGGIRLVRTGERVGMDWVRGQKFFAFCGIGNPASFDLQLRSLGGSYLGHRWFADHHAYSERDLNEIREGAAKVGAEQILTTEKDWVKIAALPEVVRRNSSIGVIELSVRFHGEDEEKLYAQILRVVRAAEEDLPRRGTKGHE